MKKDLFFLHLDNARLLRQLLAQHSSLRLSSLNLSCEPHISLFHQEQGTLQEMPVSAYHVVLGYAQHAPQLSYPDNKTLVSLKCSTFDMS